MTSVFSDRTWDWENILVYELGEGVVEVGLVLTRHGLGKSQGEG